MICDLDFFKKINDDYGHQAGDQALINFAALLKKYQRMGDLVARYGGEEFVLLCSDCNNRTATARAEEIRQVLHSTPQKVLNDKCLTASFGVTEIQAGDTPESMLRRADRALITAKNQGRNQVVQLGAGFEEEVDEQQDLESGSLLDWFLSPKSDRIEERQLFSAVPLELAVQKLQGFVADQHAQIINVEGSMVRLRADGHGLGLTRRVSDRPVPFLITLSFSKLSGEEKEIPSIANSNTRIEVTIDPIRNRDRRRADLKTRANQVVKALKSYLMATDLNEGELQMLTPAATESGREE